MKHLSLIFVDFSFLILPLVGITASAQPSSNKGWQAGVARVKITPQRPMWMAGYAARRHPAEGTLTDLWAKALALKDAGGRRVVLVTMDLVGIQKHLSGRIRDQLKTKRFMCRGRRSY